MKLINTTNTLFLVVAYLGKSALGGSLRGSIAQEAQEDRSLQFIKNNPPSVRILEPAPDTTFLSTDTILLSATVSDPEDPVVDDVVWSSKKNPNIGTGPKKVVMAQDLGLGRHVLTVTATDQAWATSTATVTIWITDMPRVRIIRPQENRVYAKHERIELYATATIKRGRQDIDNASVVWTSNKDGKIATGKWTSVFASQLSDGEHEITVTATDPLFRRGVDNIYITVGSTQNTTPWTPPVTTTAEGTDPTTTAGGTDPTSTAGGTDPSTTSVNDDDDFYDDDDDVTTVGTDASTTSSMLGSGATDSTTSSTSFATTGAP